MKPESLLERIRNQYHGVEPKGRDVDRIVDSIMHNLENILNHQQGSALAAPDLGLPDLNSARFGDGLENLRGFERVVEQCIRNYEPRAVNVQASFVEDSGNALSLGFKISLSIQMEHEIVPLVFETILGIDGRIYVENGGS